MVSELGYCFLEASIITLFMFLSFRTKEILNKTLLALISLVSVFAFSVAMTVLDTPWQIAIPLTIVTLFSLLRLLFQGKLWEHLLVSVIVILLLALSDLTVFSFMSRLLGSSYQQLVVSNGIHRFLSVMVSKLVYLILLGLIVVMKRRSYTVLSFAEYAMMSGTFLVSLSLIVLVRALVDRAGGSYEIFLLIILCVLVLNIGQFCLLLYISKKHKNQQRIAVMEQQLEMQKHNIRNLEAEYEDTAKMQHDMKHHITCALNLAEKSHDEEVVKYLSSVLQDGIGHITSYVHLQHQSLEAVMNSKIGSAANKGIPIKCMILTELESLQEIDVCILLSNLLDNAIEACERNQNASVITLKMWAEAGYYCIDIGNTVEENVLSSNPNLETLKSNHKLHGFGLKSVRDIVAKYDGVLNFRQIRNTFHVYVSLQKN